MSRATQDAMLKQLKQPFDPKFVKWRVGATNSDKTKGIALAYIDSREVQKRLDDVCGVGGWQDRYIPLDGGFICELDIWIDDRWVTKSNTAGYTHVDPIKGGGSGALKRAASAWGVGRYLYYLPNVWAEIKPQGKSYVLAEIPDLPEWAKPNTDIERWEDVAEMELDMLSGEDDMNLATVVIETVDLLRGANTEAELDQVLESLTTDQQVLLANEINTKRRALQHEANIHADSSQPSSTE
jgi:hypothetical protein